MEDKLKKEWEEVKMRSNDNRNLTGIMDGKKQTSLQSLARRYKWFSNMSMICILWVPLMMLTAFIPQEWKLWIAISFGVYFLTCSIMDRWLYYGIQGIEVSRMSVDEVSRLAYFYRKRHLQFVMILLPMAIAVIGFFAYVVMDEDSSIMIGIIVGALFGMAIGARELMAFLRDYRTLTE